MSEETQPTTETVMTSEEIRVWREKMTKYYKDQLPLLRVQKEYETILADIEEARARRMTMSIRLAQMMAGPEEEGDPAPPPEEPQETPPADAPQERKLKTEG